MPVPGTFYYRLPEGLKERPEIGKRVLVPFGKRRITGYILGFSEEIEIEEVKDVVDILDELPLFGKSELDFFRWVSNYYFSPLGEVIKTALPKGINIETSQTLSITEKGIKIISSHDNTPASFPAGDGISAGACRILKELSEKKAVTLQHLLRRLQESNLYHLLYKLRDKGLINIESRYKGRRVSPKTEKFIKSTGHGLSQEDMALTINSLGKKAPKQADILGFVRDRGKVSLRILRQEFGDPLYCLKRLQEKGLVSLFNEEVYRDPLVEEDYHPDSPPILTKRQQAVLYRVIQGIKSGEFSPFLLYGVTGSGKTEIYLRATEEALKLGREAIVLVPEISLTPQLMNRFRSRFGNNIALLHSRLSEGERYDEWRRLRRGEARIAIGARSAIFTPFENLGIVIVDEAHETSYKQDEKVRYNARDLSMVKGQLASAAVILGSATPSVESYNNSRIGKLILLNLPKRIDDRQLPIAEVIDMREGGKGDPHHGKIFSRRLREMIEETVMKKEQTLLFLNRRGFASFVICEECGFIIKCSNCSVSLVHHLKDTSLHCHYCGYSRPMPRVCPECREAKVNLLGLGTEGVEEEVKRLFPHARVARMDKDTTIRKNSHHRILKSLEKGEIDILIGTQMIAKGHDLPRVTLVGIISADTSLGLPDFRASERTFQLLTQMAGRTGRGDLPGRVIIQTYNPDHYSIKWARMHDFPGFYKEELEFRRDLNYPPFTRLVNFRIMGNIKRQTEGYAVKLGRICKDMLEQNRDYQGYIEILGPVTAPIEKLKGKYRTQILVKGQKTDILHSFVRQVLRKVPYGKKSRGVSLAVDVDPINML